jgi:hypothetical protein
MEEENEGDGWPLRSVAHGMGGTNDMAKRQSKVMKGNEVFMRHHE